MTDLVTPAAALSDRCQAVKSFASIQGEGDSEDEVELP